MTAIPGFSKEPLAVDLENAINPKEKIGLEKAINEIRNCFSLCDIFPAYNLKNFKHRISIGKRAVGGQKAGGTAMRIIGDNLAGYQIAVSKNDKNLQKLQAQFFLSDIAFSSKEFEAFLERMKDIPAFAKKMNGSGHDPDDYFTDAVVTPIQQGSPVTRSIGFGSTTVNAPVKKNPLLGDLSQAAPQDDAEKDLIDILTDTSESQTERVSLVLSRLGQGKFREEVIRFWGIGEKCIVTGCPIGKILVASHIKPWADSDNDERLSGANGLLLRADIDKLFDRHLITFEHRKEKNTFFLKPAPDNDVLYEVRRIMPKNENLSVPSFFIPSVSDEQQRLLLSFMEYHNERFTQKWKI